MSMSEADCTVTVEHAMAYEWMSALDLGALELAALERGYRRDLQDVAAARASCASLRQITDRDEQEIRRALTHIEFLRSQITRQLADAHCAEAAAA
jgi:hypothetical protein